jgi:beta-phosphoglucomutase-like phosphatase (HAD superfamily)
MIAALIFDVDGTLAETEELHRRAFNEEFAERHLDQLWPDHAHGWRWSPALYRRLLSVTGGKERIAYYLRQWLGLDPAPLAATIAAIHAGKTLRYEALLAEGGIGLREGIADLIADAGRQGCRLAIASTTSRANIDALCRACLGAAPERIFAVIAAGDEVAAKKPAADVYRLALERLDLPATACVAIEDSRNGLLAAKAAGLRCVVAPSRYSVGDEVDEADLLLPDFAAIGSLAALKRLL